MPPQAQEFKEEALNEVARADSNSIPQDSTSEEQISMDEGFEGRGIHLPYVAGEQTGFCAAPCSQMTCHQQ